MKAELKLDGFVARHFFRPEAIVLVTTLSPSGVSNVAPKTQVMPVGRENYWAFACCRDHHTYQNVVRQGEFVINFPGPELVTQISRSSADCPPDLDELQAAGLTACPSKAVGVPSIVECRVHLECRRHEVLEGLGGDSLILGQVVSASADADFAETDPEILLTKSLLAYIYPNHFAVIRHADRFTFPENYKR